MDSKEIVKRQFDLQAQSFSNWSVTKNEEYMQEYFDFIGFEEEDDCWMLPAERESFPPSVQGDLNRASSLNIGELSACMVVCLTASTSRQI